MNSEPILNIDKFRGMGDSGILYLEGLYPEIDNGNSTMGEGFAPLLLVSTQTSGYSALGEIYAMISTARVASITETYFLFMNSSGAIFSWNLTGSNINQGVVRPAPGTGANSYPDLIQTGNGNILFTSNEYICRGVRGQASGGSTTTLIDNTRVFALSREGNWDAGTTYAVGDVVESGGLPYVCILASTNNEPPNAAYWIQTTPNIATKVVNVATGVIYTVTSVSGTDNNTLNFSASGTSTTSLNQEYIIFEEDYLSVDSTPEKWQRSQSFWVRQIKQWQDQYLITNGNYLALISIDESTIDSTYKQLPARHQAIAISENVGKVLVSAETGGTGKLLSWDGSTDGWQNILDTSEPVKALASYKNGWVYIVNSTVYFTDGNQTQKIYGLNATRISRNEKIVVASHNGLIIDGDMLYIANSDETYNLIAEGCYVLDLGAVEKGFTLVRNISEDTTNDRIGGSINGLALGQRTGLTNEVFMLGETVSRVLDGSSGKANMDKSMISYTVLPRPIKITGIGLNIGRTLKDYAYDSSSFTREIQVSIGDGNRGLIGFAFTTSAGVGSSSLIVNGASNTNNKVGDEIYVITGTQFGRRTFISSISGQGTASEQWGLSPDINSDTSQSQTLKMLKVKKLDRITVTNDDLAKEIMFYTQDAGFLSNKLFIEIVVFGKDSNALILNINDIKIYGG